MCTAAQLRSSSYIGTAIHFTAFVLKSRFRSFSNGFIFQPVRISSHPVAGLLMDGAGTTLVTNGAETRLVIASLLQMVS